VLFAGVLFAAASLVTGLALWMRSPDAASGSVLLTAGLITLMATPVLRILFSLGHYISVRDWPFAATAAAVLIILAASLVYAWRL
jgi:uncharacterized membrane protein